jgi:hypothetical protein
MPGLGLALALIDRIPISYSASQLESLWDSSVFLNSTLVWALGGPIIWQPSFCKLAGASTSYYRKVMHDSLTYIYLVSHLSSPLTTREWLAES